MENETLLLGFIGGIGATELVLILLLVLILFGARKIPELAKGLGSGLREFKKAASEVKNAADLNDNAADATAVNANADNAIDASAVNAKAENESAT